MEKDETYDAKIFALSVLLSSYFIYNSMGVIDEGALDKLSYPFLKPRPCSLSFIDIAQLYYKPN